MITQFYGKGCKSYWLSVATESEITVFDKLGNTFKQIVDALMYGHKAGWLHEIKENVLLHKIAEQEWKPEEKDNRQTQSGISWLRLRKRFTKWSTLGLHQS